MAMNNIRALQQVNANELSLNVGLGSGSWHDEFAGSRVIYVGQLPFQLNEGDLLTVFEQYGRIVHVNLVRDKDTGKSRGFAFLGYEDFRSTVLAVDNFNGSTIAGRMVRVDHVKDYKPPEEELEMPTEHTVRNEEANLSRDTLEVGEKHIDQSVPSDADDIRAQRVMMKLAERRKREYAEAAEVVGGAGKSRTKSHQNRAVAASGHARHYEEGASEESRNTRSENKLRQTKKHI